MHSFREGEIFPLGDYPSKCGDKIHPLGEKIFHFGDDRIEEGKCFLFLNTHQTDMVLLLIIDTFIDVNLLLM